MLHAVSRPTHDTCPPLPYSRVLLPLVLSSFKPIIIIKEENCGVRGLPDYYLAYNQTLN